jgi:hypothetical protein
VTPLLIVIVPGLGIGFMNNPIIEISILAFILVLGGSSIVHGYRHYKSVIPIVLFTFAFTGLSAALFLPRWSWDWMLHVVFAFVLALSLLWGHLFGRESLTQHGGNPSRFSVRQKNYFSRNVRKDV